MTVDEVRRLLANPGVCPICGHPSPVVSITLDHIAREHE